MASEISLERKSRCIGSLCETFKGVDRGLIQSVADHCNYDMDQAGCLLWEIVSPQKSNISTVNKGQNNASGAVQKYDVPNKKLVDIVGFIKSGYKIMILMRGLPGSGKTTLANAILRNGLGKVNEDEFILSADDYFYQNGKYSYSVYKIDEAHRWNQRRCYGYMKRGVSPLIIDNTNLVPWEMKVYCTMAIEFGYMIEIAEPTNPWSLNIRQLAKKNTHGVDKEKIKDMNDRYEKNITPAMLLKNFKLSYTCKLPQYRFYPELRKPNATTVTEYVPPPKKPQLPVEYVHKFDTKYEEVSSPTTSTIKKPTDVDQLLNIDKEIKYKDTKTEDLISFINEHKEPPQNEESIKSVQMEEIYKHLEQNRQMMVKMMDLFKTHGGNLKDRLDAVNDEKVISPVIENKMEVDHSSAPEYQSRLYPDMTDYMGECDGSKNLEDLEKENQTLRNLLVQSQIVDSSSKKKQLDMEESPLFSIDKSPETSPTEKQRLQMERMKLFLAENRTPDDFEFVDFEEQNALDIADMVKNGKSTIPKFERKAWGLAEDALVSWELSSPVYDPIPQEVPILVETQEMSTNTSADDFRTALRANENTGAVSKITGRKTPIGHERKMNLISRKKIMLDKGSMTDDEDMKMGSGVEEQVRQLRELFPNIPVESILDVYEKCGKDVCWTVDLISNSPDFFMSTNIPTVKAEPKKEAPSTSFMFDLNDWNITPCKTEKQDEPNEEICIKNEEENEAMQQKKQEELQQLKRQLEKSVNIGKEHYSDHVWQLKSAKMGNSSIAGARKKSDSSEMMNVDDDTVYISDENSDNGSDNDYATEDLVEVNLGNSLVQQLETMFGQLMFGDNYKPVVQMPESLARQLHALYLESVCRQIEHQSEYITSQVKEDEEYAMKLQEEERKSRFGNNMDEIMDEELAMSIYKMDVEKWKNITPETLALKLTRQKLYEAFPRISRKDLDEILIAHENNYKETVEAVINSTEEHMSAANREHLMQSPISDTTLRELKIQELYFNKVTDEEDESRSAISYRDEANQLIERRHELLKKVGEHQQKRNYEVALYYRSLAEKAAKRAELANQHATQRFIDENSQKLQKGDTLDLHFLFVKGAIAALDIFIDFQISNLKSTNKPHQYYFVITGRGNRSEHGRAKLKPAVIKRLKRRTVGYTQVNPGMLKIKVLKNLPTTSDLEKSSPSS